MKMLNKDQKKSEMKSATPFDIKKSPETKPVRINKDLHQLIKMYAGYGDKSIVDLVNEAVQEYVDKYEIKKQIKEKNEQL